MTRAQVIGVCSIVVFAGTPTGCTLIGLGTGAAIDGLTLSVEAGLGGG